jgi:hypothetical protein
MESRGSAGALAQNTKSLFQPEFLRQAAEVVREPRPAKS